MPAKHFCISLICLFGTVPPPISNLRQPRYTLSTSIYDYGLFVLICFKLFNAFLLGLLIQNTLFTYLFSCLSVSLSLLNAFCSLLSYWWVRSLVFDFRSFLHLFSIKRIMRILKEIFSWNPWRAHGQLKTVSFLQKPSVQPLHKPQVILKSGLNQEMSISKLYF